MEWGRSARTGRVDSTSVGIRLLCVHRRASNTEVRQTGRTVLGGDTRRH